MSSMRTFFARATTTPASRRFGVTWGAISSVLMWAVALPRFGAYEEPPMEHLYSYVTAGGSTLRGLTVDMREYLTATEHFAGLRPAPSLGPFTQRVAAPWLAGRLPWDAPISLNVVVMALLTIGLVALVATVLELKVSRCGLVVAAVGYAVSFPVFYWGSFNYVDGAVVGLLACVLLFLVLERPFIAVGLVFVSMLFKESGLVGAFVVIAWVVAQASTDFPRRQKVVWSATALASAVSGFVVARLVGPEATEVYNPWLITPAESFNYLGANIGRAGPMAQVLLTGLLPLVLVVAAFRSSRRSELDAPRPVVWACVTGIAVGALLNVQALLSAQWDGRTLWTVYPFVFALGAVALTRSVAARTFGTRRTSSL
ncbi:MAG TPA: hypothetical protein PKX25_12170 [Microthrixaceae bacterium]|nr:hypothetical protein [Microthrixaceae bacterium]HMX66323.1 hypothetical protein [Microthrixaceae bacterium]HNA37738.1 hypothetical protein [Microthrixaceae bacterium]HNE36796.1 hypothetical protein [Microthrixaceae bacterium]HNG23932.1 hypothetical protein [Microthrixaceae bacterium]